MSLKHRFFATMTAALAALCSCANTGESGLDEVDRASRMQEFVKEISDHARAKKNGFIVVPQNGAELVFNNAGPEDGIRASYANAIDGIGIEELFYDRSLKTDDERLEVLRKIKKARPALKVMVSDIVADSDAASNAVQLCKAEGFLAFPRSSNNEDYKIIPPLSHDNSKNITSLAGAENYLYLISDAKYHDGERQKMLDDIKATNYDVVLMDLFFQGESFTKEQIAGLKKKQNGGKRLVIAYISIGSAENYRYYWQQGWKKGNPSWIKKSYAGYSDEYWVEYWNPQWKEIIFEYIDKIIAAGFDGVYLDNVEAYYFIGR